jgi:uncharacterized membrane protein
MNRFKNKLLIPVLILIILFIIPVLSLLHPGLPLTHDGQDHVARIANFYQALTEGNIVPRWAGSLNWGYGHPILEFLYPLPSYITSIFHVAGFSLVDSVKLVFALGVILSLAFMYLWLSQFLGEYPSLLGAFLFTYAPYRFVDLYVRGDIGEHLAFAFVPLVLYFVHKLYKTKNSKYAVWGAISLALLILAHNAIALMFVPFIILYGLYLAFLSSNRKSYVINLISLIVLGFLLSAFFWVPGLFEGKYTLRNIVTKGEYLSRFSDFKALVYGPWNYGQTGQFTQQLGIIQWVGLIVSPFICYIFFRKKDKNYILIAITILYSVFAIFLMLPVSNILWSRIILLQNFQFPWRFLAVTVFATSLLCAFALGFVSKKYQKAAVIVLIILVIFFSKDYFRPKGYLEKPEIFYSGIYPGTTDTGESSPVWSVRFMEKRPKAHLEVIDGSAQIKELNRTTTRHQYEINVNKETLFEENTLYFPGWSITANGSLLNVEFQNMNYRGVMLFHLPKGQYLLEADYKETKLREISDFVSILSIIVCFGFIGFRFVKR